MSCPDVLHVYTSSFFCSQTVCPGRFKNTSTRWCLCRFESYTIVEILPIATPYFFFLFFQTIYFEQEGKPIVDPKYYSQITRSEAEHIFRGDTETSIPLLDERVKSLRDAGKVLLEKYQGTWLKSLSFPQIIVLLIKFIYNKGIWCKTLPIFVEAEIRFS